MTNEEKIRQIRVEKLRVFDGYGVWMDCVDIDTILLEMAEWKDAQIKSNIEKAFGCMIFRQDHSLSNKEHQYIDLDTVQNIIESFFHVKLDEYGEQN